MDFIEIPEEKKTKTIQLCSKISGFVLGYIKWYGPWRQYCFLPSPSSVFSLGCMRDISAKINELNIDHREQLKRRV
jgi:hypothetical protein